VSPIIWLERDTAEDVNTILSLTKDFVRLTGVIRLPVLIPLLLVILRFENDPKPFY
jgi:hypothetical protein